MTHPEEHILELYVLNAESATGRRADIERHLRDCSGCRALVNEMAGFYAELDRELRAPADPAVDSAGHALTKRTPVLAVWEERLARGPGSGWGTPVKRLRYNIRRYPIAAAATTFSFAALAVVGLLMGYRTLTRDLNPSFALINAANGMFEVYNGENVLLWNRPVPNYLNVLTKSLLDQTDRFVIADPGNDGRNKILTPMFLEGEPRIPLTGLHVFDGEGGSRDIPYGRNVSFRGVAYHLPNAINDGSRMVIDTSDRRSVEVFVTAKTDRSPTAVLRYDNAFNVVGEYWHHGQIVAMYIADVDGDGRAELILCGIDDVDDATDASYPFIAVLDPKKISGLTESSATRGYGFQRSDAEKYYIRLPITVLNRQRKIGAGVARMRSVDGRLVFLWTSMLAENANVDLDFVFAKTFQPERVISTTQFHQLFEREYAQGHITTRLDDPYLEQLRTQVRFWDGKEWRPGPARVAQGPVVGSVAVPPK